MRLSIEKITNSIIYVFLIFIALTCLLPMIHVLALSFSDAVSATSNSVLFLPKGFNTMSYTLILRNPSFVQSFKVSVFRAIVGCATNMLVTILAAYPLSKENDELKGRRFISLFFIIPMLISGGLVPTFMVVKWVGLLDSIWSVILPGCVPIFNVVLMMNFMRGIDKGILESAAIDGANEFVKLIHIVLPLSRASLATLVLFQLVGHWNEWFAPTIYINNRAKWPLQTFLRQMLTSIDYTDFSAADINRLKNLSDRSLRSAMIVVATIPILMVYPFMQKHFVSGMTVGSVKG